MMAVDILKLAPLYADVVRLGIEEGVFHTEYPLESTEFILAASQFLTDIGMYPWKKEDLARRVKALGALVETQLNAPKGSFDFLSNQS